MQLEEFNPENIPQIVNRVFDLWSPDYDDDNFRRTYVEMVVRHNIAANDMQFQIVENGKLRAITFAEKKDEENSIENWYQDQYKKLSADQQIYFKNGREYLHMMDKKTFAYMNEDDVKLSLFVSLQAGYGKEILSQAMEFFRSRGYKNMFLWTDCECNVDWYFQHGYELVDESIYEPFSYDEDYKTYVFKKELV